MSTLTLRLPKSLHENIENLAKHEGISINQFLVSAAAEKMSALLTEDYLENEAKKGQRRDFEKVLKAAPDIEPDECDKLYSTTTS